MISNNKFSSTFKINKIFNCIPIWTFSKQNKKHFFEQKCEFTVAYGHLDVIEFLLQNRANINLGTLKNGITPLMSVAEEGNLEILLENEYLIKCGARINQNAPNVDTSLIIGAMQQKLGMKFV